MRVSRARMLLALCFALTSIGVVAAPASAESVMVACNGRCGYYEVRDSGPGNAGAQCNYGTSYPYKLTSIKVRPPLMHGDYPTKTKVGWSYRIQRRPVGGGNWAPISISGYQTALANDAIPAYAGSGFTFRRWFAPSNPAGYQYRVVIELQWWKNGSVEGYARVRYTWYHRVSGTNDDTQPNYCIQSF
ncbi:MAG TPA: hypothetical protein VMZ33_02780 [Candidatus Limnocylindrales bacterium]|nr:hypothetical protein [Candidatus Limnocylindrales bacterium]